MNRETKRMMRRQGQTEADGSPAARRTAPPTRRPQPKESRISASARVAEFGRDIRSELRQVAWPTRPEVANAATVVIIVLILLGGVIFLLNYGFSHGVIDLLNV
ncbi:MAG: preprotein translocase subunit SecE [Acidimicrobiales bacterium]